MGPGGMELTVLLLALLPTTAQAQAGVDTLPALNWPVPREWLNVQTGCPTAVADPPPTATAATTTVLRAVGDGATDDTVAIQACFDLVNNDTNQVSVYIPAGSYKITSKRHKTIPPSCTAT